MSPELGALCLQYLHSPAPPSSIVDHAGTILACHTQQGEIRDDAKHPTTQDSAWWSQCIDEALPPPPLPSGTSQGFCWEMVSLMGREVLTVLLRGASVWINSENSFGGNTPRLFVAPLCQIQSWYRYLSLYIVEHPT